MRVKTIKYGRNVNLGNHEKEFAEVVVEVGKDEYPEEAFARAKRFIDASLGIAEKAPLTATLGDLAKEKARG